MGRSVELPRPGRQNVPAKLSIAKFDIPGSSKPDDQLGTQDLACLNSGRVTSNPEVNGGIVSFPLADHPSARVESNVKYASLRNPLPSDRDNLQRWRKPSGKIIAA